MACGRATRWDGREAVEDPWCPLKGLRQSDLDSTLRASRAGKRIELRCNRGNPERNERSGFRLIRCSLLHSRWARGNRPKRYAFQLELGSGRKATVDREERKAGRGESSLRFDDLFQRASKVDGSGSRAFTSSPGNRSTQRVIDLEGARTVTETLEPPAIVGGKLRGCDP